MQIAFVSYAHLMPLQQFIVKFDYQKLEDIFLKCFQNYINMISRNIFNNIQSGKELAYMNKIVYCKDKYIVML